MSSAAAAAAMTVGATTRRPKNFLNCAPCQRLYACCAIAALVRVVARCGRESIETNVRCCIQTNSEMEIDEATSGALHIRLATTTARRLLLLDDDYCSTTTTQRLHHISQLSSEALGRPTQQDLG
jgi:hypothetical protein